MRGWPRCGETLTKKGALPAEQTAADAELADLTVAEVRVLLELALPLPARSPELRRCWSRWRRHKRELSRRSYRRRVSPATTTIAAASRTGQNYYLRLYY